MDTEAAYVPPGPRAFAAEVAAFGLHCCNQRKPTLMQTSNYGKMNAIPQVLCSRGDIFRGKDKRTYVKLLPERTEKSPGCLDRQREKG